MNYKYVIDPIEDAVCPNCILKIKNGVTSTVPFDDANTDYQEYLEWIADGNTPLDAD